MRFYRSLVPKNKDEMPTADDELLDLFYEKMTIQNIKGLELLQDKFQREERIYNGKESLEVLRDFLQSVSEVRASALTGKGMKKKG
jgi:CTP:phosphocholine cytidylyltransferase-like protein